MEIYIEDAILQNLIINYTLLSISEKTILQKQKILRTIGVSIVGTLFAVALTFFNIPSIFQIIIKILSGLIMCLMLIDKVVLKKLAFLFFVFLSFTFLMGGLIIAFENLFTISINGLISALIIFGFYIILKSIVKQIYRKKHLNNFYFDIKLENSGKNFDIKAYLDSGNLLQDDETGLPILIINFETFTKLFGDKITVMDFLQKKLDQKIKGRYISFSTVGGEAKMFVCNIDKVSTLEKNKQERPINVLLGITNNYFKNKECEALLSPLAL